MTFLPCPSHERTQSGDPYRAALQARVAQQLSILGSLPLLIGTVLVAFDIVHATTGLFVVVGVVLAVADVQGWRFVAPMFDRERLITGPRS